MSDPMHIDPSLRQYATPRQLEFIDAIEQHGSATKAERALGVSQGLIARSMRGLQKAADRAAALKPRGTPGFTERELTTHYDADGAVTGSSLKEGPASVHDEGGVGAGPARDGHSGFRVKGVSTYYDAGGQQRGQWVRTTADEQARADAIREAYDAMAEKLPRVKAIKPPVHTKAALCNLYTMTDTHVGMLAWHREGGADWDLAIAEHVLTGCFEQMVASSPPAQTCVINQLGDWLHQDSIEAVTPTNRHLLDSDGRFPKVIQASLRILRRMIDFALRKHERVIVLLCEGNHDISSSMWLRAMFAALYENEPRVEVNDSPLPYYVHRHGDTMLAFHHGHLKKNDDLPLLFAAQFPREWGETAKRYAHTGHRHHEAIKEHSGMKVIQHPTLAARDAYAARGGWISERQATAYTYHDRFGQVASVTVTPEMLS